MRAVSLSLVLALVACDQAPTPSVDEPNSSTHPAPPKPIGQAEAEPAAELEPAPEAEPAPLDPSSAAALEREAWNHYRGAKYAQAGAAFERLALHDAKAWKYPFNVACSAALAGDVSRAEQWLVEALRRDPDAARAKANRDPDLTILRELAWWAALMASSPDAIASWTVHEPTPVPTPPSAPHSLPVRIKGVEAGMVVPPATKFPYLEVTVALEKSAATGAKGKLHASVLCKDGERYDWDRATDKIDDVTVSVGAGHEARLEFLQTFCTPKEPSFERCELILEVVGEYGARDSLGRYCLEPGTNGVAATPGVCAQGFDPQPRTEHEFGGTDYHVIEPLNRGADWGGDWMVSWCGEALVGADRGWYELELACKGSKRQRELVIVDATGGPGTTVSMLANFFDLRREPKDCVFRLYAEGEKQPLAGVTPHCFAKVGDPLTPCPDD